MLFKMSYKEKVEQVYLVFFEDDYWIPMKRSETENGKWYVEVSISGKRCIYKYAINRSVRINDPFAEEYTVMPSGEVWSVTNTTNYQDSVYKNEIIKEVKLYMKNENEVALCAAILFSDELHSISLIWYQSNGKIIQFEEYAITEQKKKIRRCCFELDMNHKNKRQGLYKVAILVDGEQVYSDYFSFIHKRNRNESYIDISI